MRVSGLRLTNWCASPPLARLDDRAVVADVDQFFFRGDDFPAVGADVLAAGFKSVFPHCLDARPGGEQARLVLGDHRRALISASRLSVVPRLWMKRRPLSSRNRT